MILSPNENALLGIVEKYLSASWSEHQTDYVRYAKDVFYLSILWHEITKHWLTPPANSFVGI